MSAIAAIDVKNKESALVIVFKRSRPLTFGNEEQTVPVVVTYHPAYLLRTLPDKSKAWEDLCRARTLMRTLKTG